MHNISHLRQDYPHQPIDENELKRNPFLQFAVWFRDAQRMNIFEPNAMVLCTVANDSKPSARTVLLKEVDDEGFIFFTNTESRKGREINDNQHVVALFPWLPISRQITIEGIAKPVSQEISKSYFASRPRGSQLSSWASHQGDKINDRKTLENAYKEAEERFKNKEVIPPSYWGGYKIVPERFEFWQGQKDRLHDRFQYILRRDGWVIERLAP